MRGPLIGSSTPASIHTVCCGKPGIKRNGPRRGLANLNISIGIGWLVSITEQTPFCFNCWPTVPCGTLVLCCRTVRRVVAIVLILLYFSHLVCFRLICVDTVPAGLGQTHTMCRVPGDCQRGSCALVLFSGFARARWALPLVCGDCLSPALTARHRR